jgi:glycogen debranching enzyme
VVVEYDDVAAPIPYPTSYSPQAWASAAPLLLVRAFLGLNPHVPHRRIALCPRLPASWGRIALTDLRLGEATLHIEAEGEAVKVHGVPEDWQVITPND